MTTAQKLTAARWLRKLPTRAQLFTDDRKRVLEIADELEMEGLEQAVEETKV